jgi:hypothetical protein
VPPQSTIIIIIIITIIKFLKKVTRGCKRVDRDLFVTEFLLEMLKRHFGNQSGSTFECS